MTSPTQYQGKARIGGEVRHFVQRLDPQNWSSNAPQIWIHSYLVGNGGALPQRRSDPVPDAGPASHWSLPGLFFEDVIVAGIRYRNVLQTSFVDDSAANPPNIHFTYNQYECLNARGPLLEDGGIDVDNGFSDCSPDGDSPFVIVNITKTVRFTQPDFCAAEMNALAHVLVPLTLDAWLHSLLFPP